MVKHSIATGKHNVPNTLTKLKREDKLMLNLERLFRQLDFFKHYFSNMKEKLDTFRDVLKSKDTQLTLQSLLTLRKLGHSSKLIYLSKLESTKTLKILTFKVLDTITSMVNLLTMFLRIPKLIERLVTSWPSVMTEKFLLFIIHFLTKIEKCFQASKFQSKALECSMIFQLLKIMLLFQICPWNQTLKTVLKTRDFYLS